MAQIRYLRVNIVYPYKTLQNLHFIPYIEYDIQVFLALRTCYRVYRVKNGCVRNASFTPRTSACSVENLELYICSQ